VTHLEGGGFNMDIMISCVQFAMWKHIFQVGFRNFTFFSSKVRVGRKLIFPLQIAYQHVRLHVNELFERVWSLFEAFGTCVRKRSIGRSFPVGVGVRKGPASREVVLASLICDFMSQV
jgi:hypothetical protein